MTRAHGSRRSILAGLFATFVVAACQPGTEPPPPVREPGRLIVSANVAGTLIKTVVVKVSAADINPDLVFNLELDANNRATSTITVPAGSGRTITIHAYDAGGIETHRGSKSGINVNEGANNPPLSIAVLSLGGGQQITVQLSSHIVAVAPISATVSLATGPTVTLTATITAADGTIVSPNGELQWATDAPAVATVSAAGVVTGKMAGTATIMATYRGIGASAAITVAP